MDADSVLLDTDAVISLSFTDESNHIRALHIQRQLTLKKIKLLVINLVIYEIVTVISYRRGQKDAIDFYNDDKDKLSPVIWIDHELEEDTYDIFISQTKKGTSFVDCANMAVMKKFALSTIFSFDEIYKRNGFKLAGIDKVLEL